MEKWEEVQENTIPCGKYCVLLRNGEETGLFIELENVEYSIKINFGAVSALRMFDEGVLLQNIFNQNVLSNYKKDNFSNVIYKVTDGEFGKLIKTSCNELYDYLELNHFVIVTMNYVIEVVSKWEPCVEVNRK